VEMGQFLDDPSAAAGELRRRAAMQNQTDLGFLFYAHWAAFYGDTELALEYLSELVPGYPDAPLLWRPVFRDVRKQPGFKALVQRAGLVDYWRTYDSWGDFCRPTSGDDFECW
jgi:hypothetical protein